MARRVIAMTGRTPGHDSSPGWRDVRESHGRIARTRKGERPPTFEVVCLDGDSREVFVVPRISGGEEHVEKLFLTIPKQLIKEPIIHTLGKRFNVIPNIRAGSITETLARIALELSGDPAEIEKAVAYIKNLGIQVDPIEDEGSEP